MNDNNTYTRVADDSKFRLVNATGGGIPPYDNFGDNVVSIPKGYVLEVLKEDGTETIVSSHQPNEVTYSIMPSGNKIYLPAGIPTERVWVRCSQGGIEMKVPNYLERDTNRQYIFIPGGADHVELVGDKYFNCAYTLRRT